jgi:hypothetical protein
MSVSYLIFGTTGTFSGFWYSKRYTDNNDFNSCH